MLKKIAILFLSLLTIVLMLAAVACGSESTSSVSENSEKVLVPQRAGMIARISIGSVLADNTIRNAYDEADKGTDAPTTLDELLQTSRDKTGLDFTAFKEATLFGDINDLSKVTPENGLAASQGYFGVIISGTFKNDELIAGIESETGQKLESESYNGYKIYTITDTSNSNTNTLALLDESVLVTGSSEAIKDVIDVKNGKPGLSGDLLATYENIDGSLGKLALSVPDEWLNQMQDEQDTGILSTSELEAFKEMKTISITFDKAGDNTNLEIKAGFSNGASANSAKSGIEELISNLKEFLKMSEDSSSTPETAALIDLLDSVRLSISDNWLILHLELTMDQVEEITPLLQGTF